MDQGQKRPAVCWPEGTTGTHRLGGTEARTWGRSRGCSGCILPLSRPSSGGTGGRWCRSRYRTRGHPASAQARWQQGSSQEGKGGGGAARPRCALGEGPRRRCGTARGAWRGACRTCTRMPGFWLRFFFAGTAASCSASMAGVSAASPANREARHVDAGQRAVGMAPLQVRPADS